MARCYSGQVTIRQPLRHRQLPPIWLISDARNDDVLESVLRRLPRGSGLVFRHYHLDPAKRRARWDRIVRRARARGHVIALSGSVRQARAWGADAVYGSPARLAHGRGLWRLATVHSLGEIASAARAGADALFLSPVFPTRSHPGGSTLGPVRALLLAQRSGRHTIFLGGMNRRKFRSLARAPQVGGWAAIDGLSTI